MGHSRSHIASLASLLVVLYFLLVPRRAQAYLDPGLGSMAWQLLVAGLLAVSYVVGKYWRVIKKWLGRPSGAESDNSEDRE